MTEGKPIQTKEHPRKQSIGGTLEQNVPWSDDADGGNAGSVNECYSLVSGGVLRNTETFISKWRSTEGNTEPKKPFW